LAWCCLSILHTRSRTRPHRRDPLVDFHWHPCEGLGVVLPVHTPHTRAVRAWWAPEWVAGAPPPPPPMPVASAAALRRTYFSPLLTRESVAVVTFRCRLVCSLKAGVEVANSVSVAAAPAVKSRAAIQVTGWRGLRPWVEGLG
jgi:hypothetical protein